MSVDLEKIASLLEGAYQQIESLEGEKASLENENSELKNAVELSKQASFDENNFDSSSLGTVYDGAFDSDNSEDKLDEFLKY